MALSLLVFEISLLEAANDTPLDLVLVVIHIPVETRDLKDHLQDLLFGLERPIVVPDVLKPLRLFFVVFHVPH